jgi:predicted flap endonuclease-1-like 5' DNA nuclease
VATDQGLAPNPETIVAYYQDEIAQLHALTEQVAQAPQKPETAAPSHAEAPQAAPTVSDDLTRLDGIGPAFADKLRASGVATFAALAASTPDALASIVQAADWRRPDYASWIDQARALVG